MGHYQKINPTARERGQGIVPGNVFPFFEWRGRRFAVLICNDILEGTEPFPRARFHFGLFDELRRLQLDVIFIPLISPYRRTDTSTTKEGRDEAFQEMARQTGTFIVKVSGVGKLQGEKTVGRSLVVSKEGEILLRPKGENQEEILLGTF